MDGFLASILASLKTIKLWQLAAALVVLFGSAAATFSVYDRVGAPTELDLEENVQIIPVQYGDLINQVSTSGNLTYPNRNVLRFGSAGTVAEIMVEEGDRVAEGQPLARIDDATASELSLKVATARYDLDAAQDTLDELLNPNGIRVADARLRVAEESLKLDAAKATLAEMALDHQQALAKAQESAADAEVARIQARDRVFNFPGEFYQALVDARLHEANSLLALEQAEESLSAFGTDYPDDLANAVRARTNGKLALEAAVEALAEFSPDHLHNLASAQDRLASAEVGLRAAQDALADFGASHKRQLAEAQRAEVLARERLELDQAALERYESNNPDRLRALRDTRDSLSDQVDAAQTDLARMKRLQADGAGGLSSHIWRLENTLEVLELELSDATESLIAVGKLEADVEVSETQWAKARAELDPLEFGSDQLLLAELAAAVTLAQFDFDQVNQDLAGLHAGPNPFQIADLEASVEVARAELDLRNQALEKLQGGPDAILKQQLFLAHESAQADLAAAKDALTKLIQVPGPEVVAFYQARVNALGQGPSDGPQGLQSQPLAFPIASDPDLQYPQLSRDIFDAIQAGADHRDLELLEASLALFEINLTLAKQEQSSLELGLDPMDLSLKQAEAASAAAGLAQAEKDLAELLSGSLSQEALLVQAKLDSAQRELAHAITLAEDAVLRSPVSGFVAKVNVEKGDPVNANAVIIEVVDPSVLEVDGVVDEIDVLSILVGTPADISLDALPGQRIRGTVTQIALAALNQQGVVSYPIRVEVEPPEGITLREGMTTVANILLQEERNILLIPQQSLYGTYDSPVVRLVKDGGIIEETPVELGNSDDFWVEVRSGLQEGDRLAMASAEVSTTGAGFRGLRGATGGGGGRRPSR